MKKTIFYLILISLLYSSCKKTVETPLPSPTQIITFSPTSGTTGTEITIVGANFTGATSVSFGGVAASSFTVVNATTITAKVGIGSSGEVTVFAPTGTAKLSGFTYVNPPPTIASISNKSGTTNSIITITGTNFNGATAVSFGGVAASSFKVDNATTITAVVGAGNSGEIVVTTPSGNATLTGFVFNSPNVTSCKIEDKFNSPVVVGFTKNLYRVPSTGTVKVGIIFVDFNEAIATKTPKEIFETYLSPEGEDFFKTMSYNKLKVELEPTFEWFRMSKSGTSYSFSTFADHKAYIQEAISLANPKIDFSKYNHVYVITDPNNSPLAGAAAWNSNGNANGISVDGKFVNNAFTSGKALKDWAKGLLFAHEFGHNLGLVDLYPYNGTQHRFVGEYSLMGLISGIAPELLGWERWTLGWLDDNQVVCQGNVGNGSVTLTPIETSGGVKLLTIPIDTKSTIVVESRRKLGYDKNLVKEGPLVYLVDASIASGNGAVKVLPINETDNKKHQATMSVAQTITYQGITITYTSRSNDGDVITFEKK